VDNASGSGLTEEAEEDLANNNDPNNNGAAAATVALPDANELQIVDRIIDDVREAESYIGRH